MLSLSLLILLDSTLDGHVLMLSRLLWKMMVIIGLSNCVLDGVILFAFEDDRLAMHLEELHCVGFARDAYSL